MKRTPFFLGSHELVLDGKNRCSIPSVIRKNFDPADEGSLFITLKASVLWIYTLGHFRRLVKKHLVAGLMPGEMQKNFTYLTLSLGAEVECDSAGRVVLPEMLVSRANLGREITLVGANDHLEIHDRELWRQKRDKLLIQAEILEAWAQETLRTPVNQESGMNPVTGRNESKD